MRGSEAMGAQRARRASRLVALGAGAIVVSATRARPRRREKAAQRRTRQRRALLARFGRSDARMPARTPDPLLRASTSRRRRFGLLAALGLGALLAHGLALVFFSLVGWGLQGRMTSGRRPSERVEVAIQSAPKPPPPPIEKPASKPTAPKAKVARRQIAKAPVAPDPIAPPPPAHEAPRAAPPRRIVGLSLGSSVVGGAGPSFAIGNTRMGETAQKAADPASVASLRDNRPSSRVPTAGVDFRPPVKSATVEPAYPADLRADGIEGDVTLLVAIGSDGRVSRVEVVRASPYAAFVEAAVAAAKQERYVPAQQGGRAVEHVITMTTRFRLSND